ncbi:hypothetical protein, partial [Sulfuriferula plumbiphila]
MVKKIPSTLAIALLSVFLSGNAAAATEQEAQVQLDHVQAKTADAQQTAHAVLSDLVAAGVPVDQAYAVVRSGVEHDYSASDLRRVGDEIRNQVRQGIPAEQVTKTADQAIDAGYSAAATQNVLNTFQARVEQGMPATQASARSASDISLNKPTERSGVRMGSGA